MKLSNLHKNTVMLEKNAIFYILLRLKVFFKKFLLKDFQKCSINKLLLKISQNSQENTCAKVSFLIKKEALPLIFKKTFFTGHIRTTTP